jgi:hypothetical protein
MGKKKKGYLRDINVKGKDYKWIINTKSYGYLKLKIWDENKKVIFDSEIEADVITPKGIRDYILKLNE